jgi:hypothetical protein
MDPTRRPGWLTIAEAMVLLLALPGVPQRWGPTDSCS